MSGQSIQTKDRENNVIRSLIIQVSRRRGLWPETLSSVMIGHHHPLRAWLRAVSSRHHCLLKRKFFAFFRVGVACSHIFFDDFWEHIKRQRNQQFAFNKAYLHKVISSALNKVWPWCSNTVVSPGLYRAGLWAELAVRLMCEGSRVPHSEGSPSV